MRRWRYGLAVGLLAALGACSNTMINAGHPPKPIAMQPVVAPEVVKQVQSKLRDSGYYKQGVVDGIWGSGTESAIRSFQRDHNLDVSGQLDVSTLQALKDVSGAMAANNITPAQPMAANTDQPPVENAAAR
ncbi:MAG: hypothetical protein QOH05_698 [Acetobacteraceae bacterium]|jgi:N-acetylmuramoyl-L-alanine amidase|nr:hypothetical protein [Acetobacteraceae bacterium]